MLETALSIVIAALAYCLGRQAGHYRALKEVEEILEHVVESLMMDNCEVVEEGEDA